LAPISPTARRSRSLPHATPANIIAAIRQNPPAPTQSDSFKLGRRVDVGDVRTRAAMESGSKPSIFM